MVKERRKKTIKRRKYRQRREIERMVKRRNKGDRKERGRERRNVK